MGSQSQILLEQTLIFTESDDQQHRKILLELKKGYQELHIDFSYSPQDVPEEKALRSIAAMLPKYDQKNNLQANDFLPLKNLITLSLAYEEAYLGCRHNKKTEQNIMISETASSLGFIPQSVQPGNWEIQLNLHCVQSTVTVNIAVKGVTNK